MKPIDIKAIWDSRLLYERPYTVLNNENVADILKDFR